jgi:hypothetical protein
MSFCFNGAGTPLGCAANAKAQAAQEAARDYSAHAKEVIECAGEAIAAAATLCQGVVTYQASGHFDSSGNGNLTVEVRAHRKVPQDSLPQPDSTVYVGGS